MIPKPIRMLVASLAGVTALVLAGNVVGQSPPSSDVRVSVKPSQARALSPLDDERLLRAARADRSRPTTTTPPTTVTTARKVSPPTSLAPTKPPRAPSSEVDRAIHEAAVEFGVDEDRMIRLAWCESTMNPNADNGTHAGLLQQSKYYWRDHYEGGKLKQGRVEAFNAAFPHAPVAGNIYSPFDNARVSAWMMTWKNGFDHWECK